MKLPDNLPGRISTTAFVNWFDLDEYLRGIYQCGGTHLPADVNNDTETSTYVRPEFSSEFAEMEADTALELYKKGALDDYHIYALLDRACADGHLPEGQYVIEVSW